MGVSATALVFAQFVGGMVRPHRGASALRVAWELWHSMLGRAAIVLGVFNVFSGLLVARDIGVVANYNLWTAWAAGARPRVGLTRLRRLMMHALAPPPPTHPPASLGFSWIAGALVHKGVEQRERARELDAAAAGDGGDRVRGDDKAAAAALA